MKKRGRVRMGEKDRRKERRRGKEIIRNSGRKI